MRTPLRPLLLAVACAAATVLAGCATPPTDPDALAEFRETNDPLEPMNRVFYNVNNAMDVVVLRPIALGYRAAVPQPVRTGVHNVLTNLSTPVVFVNDVLQGKPQRAADSMARMLINTTMGAAGIFDVAEKMGVPAHDSDFGMTLAIWGMPDGAYLFLPVLGPTNPRDAVGFGVDTAMDPFGWLGQGDVVEALRWARFGLAAVDARVGVLDDLDKITSQALDPYATIRSLARQHRQSQIDDARNSPPLRGAAKPTP
jgi:phospholipid-binding lipoprotein MlaA